ncbi:hypothetical protein Bca101_034819 [Brassica carinata]
MTAMREKLQIALFSLLFLQLVYLPSNATPDLALDKKLYLLIFGKPFGATSDKTVWHFFEINCVESALKFLGDLTHTYFVGNAPMAHMVIQATEEITSRTDTHHLNRLHLQETPDLPSYKRFFFRCTVVAASKYKISNCEDFMWVTKDELLAFFPEHAEFFNNTIIS